MASSIPAVRHVADCGGPRHLGSIWIGGVVPVPRPHLTALLAVPTMGLRLNGPPPASDLLAHQFIHVSVMKGTDRPGRSIRDLQRKKREAEQQRAGTCQRGNIFMRVKPSPHKGVSYIDNLNVDDGTLSRGFLLS